jgi:hypothetical protein
MWPNFIKLMHPHHCPSPLSLSVFKYVLIKSLAPVHFLLFEIVLFSTDHNITILSSLRYWSLSYYCVFNIREHPNLYCSELTHVFGHAKMYFAQLRSSMFNFFFCLIKNGSTMVTTAAEVYLATRM